MCTMTESGPSIESSALERFRGYLSVLARASVGRELGARFDASDIVQATLLDAFVKKDQFQGQTQAEYLAWLRTIMVHNVADAIRANRRDKRDVRRELALEAAVDDSLARADRWLAADQTSPSQYVDRVEQSLALADAIQQLPVDQGQAVILHHMQGMPLKDLALLMGRSEPAVAGLLYRGLKQLRALLRAELPEE